MKQKNYPKVLGAIDIGSFKISAFIVSPETGGGLSVIGCATQKSEGIRQGVIIDMRLARQVIAKVVEQAEQMAGVSCPNWICNACSTGLSSQVLSGMLEMRGKEITEDDIDQVSDNAFSAFKKEDVSILHKLRLKFQIDDLPELIDPRGMPAHTLRSNMNVISINSFPLKTQEMVLKSCHLDVKKRMAAPYASALSVLTPDEKEQGAFVLDIGAEVTGLSLFEHGQLLHLTSFPFGGAYLTEEIASELTVTLADAERLKVLYGHALPFEDDREIAVIRIGEQDESFVTRTDLSRIIAPIVEEWLLFVQKYMKDLGAEQMKGRRVVLSGGGAMLYGLLDVAGAILDKHVRIGYPLSLSGLPEQCQGPDYATLAGMILFAFKGMSFSESSSSSSFGIKSWFLKHI